MNEPMTFQSFRKAGVQMTKDQFDAVYNKDDVPKEAICVFVYPYGLHIELMPTGKFVVAFDTTEREFDELPAAEYYFWEHYADNEVNHHIYEAWDLRRKICEKGSLFQTTSEQFIKSFGDLHYLLQNENQGYINEYFVEHYPKDVESFCDLHAKFTKWFNLTFNNET